MIHKHIFSIILVISLSTSQATIICPKCEYKVCHKTDPNKLNIHLVPHTHDDAGWLKTVDQYYYGGRQRHAPFGVQYIIDSVLSELEANPDRRFIYVESSFLWRWWLDRGDYHREKMKRLIKDGRLQLTHGGWVMSDEATPHYTALIHQMSFGLKFLHEVFGECSHPNIAWQIDSFGHSSEVALQFAEMGYDAVFFGRIDRDDMKNRMNEKKLEMIWRPDPKLGPNGEIFVGVLYNLYMPPDGFCFDVFCYDEPIMDSPNMHGNNVEHRVSAFVYYAKQWAKSYQTKNVMITMGGDFNYMVAGSWFTNMDKLIKYGNELYKDVNLIYSTPACYLESLNRANVTWPVKDVDDFFPYSSYEGKYWTGYYTSRPSLKYLAHKVNQLLIASKSLATFLRNHVKKSIFLLERAVALLQHHDAISGTEKQHVADDYTIYLQEAITAGEELFTIAFRKHFGSHYRHQHFCMRMNISECKLSEERNVFTVHLYNPLSHSVDTVVRLPVQFGKFIILGHKGIVESELVPLPRQVLNIPGRKSSAKHDLTFIAKNLEPLAITSYHVKRDMTENITSLPNLELLEETDCNGTCEGTIVVDNFGLCQLLFNASTGLLTSIVIDNVSIEFEQNFYYYLGSRSYDFRASGAYTFGPANNEAFEISKKVTLHVHTGHNIVEVHQTFTPWVSQIIRMRKGDCSVEFTWLVGPIHISRSESKEIITLYKTGIKSNGQFWTDSNGRRFMRRIRNWRSSWKFSNNEPIASNYYPVTSAARINDETTCLTILTDRAQGAASLNDGEIEFMIHRRLTSDDGKGVLEPLNEIEHGLGLVARGTHIVQIFKSPQGCQGEAAIKHRKTALSISVGPWLSLSTVDVSAEAGRLEVPRKMVSLLKTPLPENVHLLSLERRSNSTILIRLEHIYEKGEHPTLSLPAVITLTDIFRKIYIHQVDELTLDGNQYKQCYEKLKWEHDGVSHIPFNDDVRKAFSIILQPMQIITLLLTVSEDYY